MLQLVAEHWNGCDVSPLKFADGSLGPRPSLPGVSGDIPVHEREAVVEVGHGGVKSGDGLECVQAGGTSEGSPAFFAVLL